MHITKLLASNSYKADILFLVCQPNPQNHFELKGITNDLMGDRSSETFAQGKITLG